MVAPAIAAKATPPIRYIFIAEPSSSRLRNSYAPDHDQELNSCAGGRSVFRRKRSIVRLNGNVAPLLFRSGPARMGERLGHVVVGIEDAGLPRHEPDRRDAFESGISDKTI